MEEALKDWGRRNEEKEMSTAGEQIEITIDRRWVVSLKDKLKVTEQPAWRTEQPTIFRVLPHLRGIEPKAYEPTIVSLGPFHHHKSHLKAMDHLKYKYLSKFLGRNPEKPLEDYLKLIKENERQARMAYSEEVEMSSDDFVQMMLLDCCFVIETILPEEEGQATIWSLSPVLVRDMLILENQLPFCILQPLFDSTFLRQSLDLSSLILGFLSKASTHFTLWRKNTVMCDAGMKVEIDVDKAWMDTLRRKVEEAKWDQWRTEQARIFKVPGVLQEAEPRAYKPRIVSLGPYHHGKSELQPMEELKWNYLRRFVRRQPQKKLEDYLNETRELVNRSRRFYFGDKVNPNESSMIMSDNKFVEMMLLDGSFVIEIMISWVKGVSERKVGQNAIKNTIWSPLAVAQDMLLLENQLPFFLLDCLHDTAFPEDAGGLTELTQEFLRMFIMFMNDNERVPRHGFHHILHLCHFCIVAAKKPYNSKTQPSWSLMFEGMQKERMNMLSFFRDNPVPVEQPASMIPWIPSATQLKVAGIQFKMKTRAKSFLDITFQNGKLEIPQLVVDDQTNVLFKNLIAFEQCSQDAGTHLAAYASLMDSIINTAADVELLQKDQIIINTSGDNTEVANFFNKLCKDVLIKDEDYLTSIYRDVNKHRGIKYHIWWRTLHRDYFKNPWTIIWLCAAIFAFILTITQTVYTVLSYIRPPK
ncbi:unnamed protein product [Musa acuminata subsp. malaccensis]|uniref:(wild Malaysian banana) hypothetical protein n=1 Tax=Musa acuminata subsp. malaccensis TaxID=214687 RepID=A0A804IJX7_MUSAM|nr:unnamed protein product [Musa acuminata subsp. malaccensis]